MAIRVHHVLTRLGFGGVPESTALTCEGLRARGFDVTLLTGPGFGNENAILERAKRAGYEIVLLDSLHEGVNPWSDWRSSRALRRVFLEQAPDIVHTHSGKAGFLGRRAAHLEGVPVIVHTMHYLPFHESQGLLDRLFDRWRERRAAAWCHHIFCGGEGVKEVAIEAGLGSPDFFSVAYSGMEVDRFLASQDSAAVRRSLGIPEDAVVAGVISSLAPLRGHDHLIEAGEGLHLLFIGEGELRDDLDRRAKAKGIPVTFAGFVPPERIPEMVAAMDVLVHTSLQEGLPQAIPQALIAGKPVVAFDGSAVREVVINGITGYLVAPGNTEMLRDSLMKVLSRPDRGREMGERGRGRLARIFRADAMVDTIAAKYEDLLRATKQSPHRGP